MYTSDDTTVLKAHTYDSKRETTVGMFVGSNGLIAADGYTVNQETTKTVDLKKTASAFECNFRISSGFTPHLHALGKGSTELEYAVKTASEKDSKGDIVRPTIINGNQLAAEPSNENIMTTDFYSFTQSTDASDENGLYGKMNNYVLHEVIDAEWENVANSFSGTYGKELKNGDFKWYGRTSEPLWLPNDAATTQTNKFDSEYYIGYFRPESIKVLPLIKL